MTFRTTETPEFEIAAAQKDLEDYLASLPRFQRHKVASVLGKFGLERSRTSAGKSMIPLVYVLTADEPISLERPNLTGRQFRTACAVCSGAAEDLPGFDCLAEVRETLMRYARCLFLWSVLADSAN